MENLASRSDSENNPVSNEDKAYLQQVEALFTDPAAAETIEKARHYENDHRYYRDFRAASDQDLHMFRAECVRKLDEEWLYSGQTVRITGLGIVHEPGSRAITHEKFVDQEVISQGFDFIAYASSAHAEAVTDYRAMLIFIQESDGVRKNIAAYPEDVSIESDVFSLEYADTILRVSYPDLYDLINESYDKAGNSDTDKVRALRNIALLEGADDTENAWLRRASERYVEDLIDLETELPYQIIAKGAYYTANAQGKLIEHKATAERHELAHVQSVRFTPVAPCAEEAEFAITQPTLEVINYSGIRNSRGELRYYPFSSVRELNNLRCLSRDYRAE